MKPGWKIKTMGDVGTFQRGGGFLKSDFVENGFPCIHYGQIHMKLGATTYSHLTCIPASVAAKSKIASTGDVIIAITSEDVAGSCKSTAWMGDYDVAVGAHAAIFKHNLNPLFVSYYIQSCYFQKEKEAYTHGFKVVEIKPSDIAKIPIRFPSLPEQQRIVDILDREFAKIDALKANAEKSLQAAKDLFQATLKKELEPKEGWKKFSLKDVCLEYGDYGMSLPSKVYDGVRYLRITDITEWGELYDDRVSVDADVIDEKYMLIDGDVLFARTGATVGKTLIYNDRFGSCCYAGYLIRYRPDQSIVLPRMLYYITHSASYYDWVAVSQKSATLPNISAKLYNAYEMYLPVIAVQSKIISKLDELYDKCQTLRENYQKTLSLCDVLKQAILRKAFNVEIK